MLDAVARINGAPLKIEEAPRRAGDPPSLIADGEDKGKVQVEVLDVNLNYVVRGTDVDFETEARDAAAVAEAAIDGIQVAEGHRGAMAAEETFA